MATQRLDFHNEIKYELKGYEFDKSIAKRLPVETKVFLEKIGLPEVEIFDALKFNPFSRNTQVVDNGLKAFLIIGEFFFNGSFLKVFLNSRTGRIFIEDPYTINNVIFMNSDIFSFKSFLDLHAGQIIEYIDLSDSEIKEKQPDQWLAKRFNVLDTQAMEDSTHFWSVFINDIRGHFDEIE